LEEADLAKLWPLFMNLILATDMAKHFDIMEDLKKMVAARRKWHTNQKDRRLMMQVLIKSADLSPAARNFQTADKSEMAVCEEFFRQGMLDKVPDIVYEEGFTDRDHLDKEYSQVPFYKGVVVPLFELLGKACPVLGTLPQHVKLNVTKWEERHAKKLAEARKEAEDAAAAAAATAASEEDAKAVEETQNKIDAIELDDEAAEQATEVLDKA
jgi:glutamyl/glutaminyl-tRNA synthetase